ncbi:Phosphoribosyl-ATP pyrophosphohydrolase-like [uncultured Caudovirales phage]|uniref:Phosphoribosyl-ATP pyrophosphohydrolase-like n=1 Tax=uncultured Caudovirales phage TaxID=2100421 RepID=A0A6J5NYX1_9CAUD|nr:Phosphoribosyl-ATP pyrophosphohydrolase-like [uncultured Caudovirales phage]
MSDMYKDVMEFHKAFSLPIGTAPVLPNKNERDLRKNLLAEEYNEYLDGEEANDIVEIADALADIIYIACGTAVSYGIPLDKIFDEVHRSNMAKLVDGKVLRREDGKVIKPAGWQAPNIEKIIEDRKNALQNDLITL